MSTNDLDQSAAELGMGGKLAPETDDAGYRKRMERRQQVQKQRVEERNKEKGLVLVFTGQGKGKTTAGLEMGLHRLEPEAPKALHPANTQRRHRRDRVVNPAVAVGQRPQK